MSLNIQRLPQSLSKVGFEEIKVISVYKRKVKKLGPTFQPDGGRNETPILNEVVSGLKFENSFLFHGLGVTN